MERVTWLGKFRSTSLVVLAAGLALIGWDLANGSEQEAKRPLVIFFGGFGANAVDMDAWKAAAEASSPYGKSFDFEAVSYPGNIDSSERKAVSAGKELIDAAVSRVAANAEREVLVVGHSSGAALAARVVERSFDRRNVTLVILDDGVDIGFSPPRGFDSTTQVECWSAREGELTSINLQKTSRFCKKYHEMAVTGCRTRECLHFRLVNHNARPDLTFSSAATLMPDGSSAAYANLSINLNWLAPYQR